MSIDAHVGRVTGKRVVDGESMAALIIEMGIVPFFANPIVGYSIEEHTAPQDWFTDESLGPWDWKIPCVQTGEIAYGKFLWGGKAAFASVPVYRELMNIRRRSLQPSAEQQKIMDFVQENGSISIAQVRALLGVKKNVADAHIARLQYQTRLVTGDIVRVYRGEDLHYNGWQRSSFCTPETLFEDDGADFPFPGLSATSLKSSLTPEESLQFLRDTVCRAVGETVPEKLLEKLLGKY